MRHTPICAPAVKPVRSALSGRLIESIEPRLLFATVQGQILGLPTTPTSQQVDSFTVRFDRPVEGFDVADLAVTRQESQHPVEVVLDVPGVTVHATDPTTYVVSGVANRLNGAGTIRFAMAAGHTLSEPGGTAVQAELSASYQALYPLSVQILTDHPSRRASALTSVGFAFHSGMDIRTFGVEDVRLYRDGVELPLGDDLEMWQEGSSSIDSFYLMGIAPYNTAPGVYKIVVLADGIVAPNGATLRGNVESSWEIVDGGSFVSDRPALADAHVRNGTYAQTNFGQAPIMEVGWSNAANDGRQAYISFDISGINVRPELGGRVQAMVMAWSADGARMDLRYTPVSGNWSENQINWSNKIPLPEYQPVFNTSVYGVPRTIPMELTSTVLAAQAAGQSTVTLLIQGYNATGRVVYIASGESDNGPYLRWLQESATEPVRAVLPSTPVLVQEGGTTQLQVVLNREPALEHGVYYDWRYPEADLSIAGGATSGFLFFDRSNWNVPQTITFAAAEDVDGYDGAATLRISGGEIVVREQDNDVVPAPPAVSRTLRPNGDAYIRDGAHRYTMFGGTTDLQVAKGTVSNSRESYLWFDLGAVTAPTQSAKLRLHGRLDAAGSTTLTVHAFGIFGWTSLLWDATPPRKGAAITTFTMPDATARWYELDVTSYVAGLRAQGATSIAFALTASTSGKPVAIFSSKEAAANKPELRIVEGTGPVSPPPPPPPTSGVTVLRAAGDAFVRDGTYAAQNYGSATALEVRRSGSGGYSRQSYLSFNLTTLTTITSAKLRLYGNLVDDRAATGDVQVFATATGWTESGIKWGNKPAPSGAALGKITVAGRTAKWYELDITSWLIAQKRAGKTQVSLALIAPLVTANAATFASDEAAANRPELRVQG